jgi:UDP-GlcNAc:undecaprenyl-phosphate GlcNAc-1-phosphate transferase
VGSYLLVFIVAAAFTAVLLPATFMLARRLGAMDNTRDPPVPRIGGVAIAAGGGIALLLVGLIFAPTGNTLLASSASVGPVLAAAGVILALGVTDDIRPLRAGVKLGVQLAIVVVLWAVGVRVELLSLPFGAADLGPVAGAVVTALWFVGITNAFNLLDGADGVAAGSAFFASAAVFMMALTLGHPGIGLVAAALAGALLGFLPFNFPPARAFLGDSGSLLTGFLLAGLAVEGSTKGPTLVAIAVPLIAFGVPVLDTTITLFRRVVRGQPVFRPDREHVHHGLARAGLSPRQVLGVLYAASAAFALAAMMFINPGVRTYAVGFVVVGAGVAIVVRFLRLHELNELARVARRGLLKPKTIALNVQLRRAAERLGSARTLDDLMAGLAILLERSEFDDVLLLVAPKADRRGQARVWHLQHGQFVEAWPRRREDEWEIVCPFQGAGWNGQLLLRRRLGRPTLMLDVNLLLDLVQPALAQAALGIESPAPASPTVPDR